ncbi:MAG: HlyD family type I secretion periplasmic adaptor subunit [Burkholderiaceae bacterium]|nr:HlyD family type I secretion periplasmic adaptor subunit [Roseateles sp.]MBV8469597.1 HlyD family type I secretion periplasmic adaptor subunit [Burkholderiaceae bacterium]
MSSPSKKGAATLTARDNLFISSLTAAHLDEPLPRATWILYLLLAALIAAVTWASMTHIDEISRIDGRVIPDGSEQVISSLESGLVAEVLVHEGQQVEAGQDLVRLDPTRVEAQQNEGQIKLLSLKATVARLNAEAFGHALHFPDDVMRSQILVADETEVYEARRRGLGEAVSSIDRNVASLQKEERISRDMAAKGLMSDVEVMRLTRQINDMQAQRADRISRFRQEASAELVRVQNELSMLQEQMIVRKDALVRTVLKSPVKGLVKSIRANTVGGVVAGGSPIMEIVPLGPKVLIEAKIKPKDIGFIKVGQTAMVKINGYDFSYNGGLEGKVEYISPDALGETDKNAESGYYRALIHSDKNTLIDHGKPLPVIPGMTATVEIRTGERSVLSYLLRPMMKSREAMQER